MLGGRTPKTRKGIELCGFDNKEVHKQRRRQDGREKCWSVYAGGVASRCADTQPRRDPDSGLEPKQHTEKDENCVVSLIGGLKKKKKKANSITEGKMVADKSWAWGK